MRKELEFEKAHSEMGNLALSIHSYSEVLDRLHEAAGTLLQTAKSNISFTKSTAEGLSMIANGYPFEPGDEILSYVHEYPANHYPWRLQEKLRGVKLVLLSDSRYRSAPDDTRPTAWSMEELKRLVTSRTRMVALSHVQFASGFAADLAELGAFCKERGIDLIIDAAQSLGSLPLYPEECGVAAVAASGWKWLMGPIGSSLLYTSPQLRAKLELSMAGASLMRQGDDYLNHTWDPIEDGGIFEYATVPICLAMALECAIRENFLRYGLENIRAEISRLQAIALEGLDRSRLHPLEFPEANRSGILSLSVRGGKADELARSAGAKGVVCTVRGGYLRFAPHFYSSDDEIERAVRVLNELAPQAG